MLLPLAWCLLALWLGGGQHQLQALRISSIEVPAVVMNSSQALLVCNYELQGDQLYSVKWYKNYVEFYRFQPADVSHESAPSQQQQHEFDLEGIQLNLQKSNLSHVYLRQVSLASEGTYKCEVSADSPSFATVSMERQMKVYVLPKQKLTIVENIDASTPERSTGIYNVNDMVNLTCIVGWSRPMAKLSWQLNEQPILETSKWLSRTIDLESRTKLTLAFQLQPSHLLRQSRGGSGGQVVRLRCLALLTVDFRAETSVQLSGGKSSLSRRPQRQPPPISLPTPSSYMSVSPGGDLQSAGSRSSIESGPIYRWPRPKTGANQARRRMPSGGNDALIGDSWMSISSGSNGEASANGDPSEGSLNDGRPFVANNRSRPMAGGNQFSWRQWRQQADHIEQVVVSGARPNELEAPMVEAQMRHRWIEEPAPGETSSTALEFVNDGGGASSSGPAQVDGSHREWRNSRQDYELNDLVRFTCRPRLGSSSHWELQSATRRPNEPNNHVWANPKQVYSTWLINNKEISEERVNAFDGTNFYYALNDGPSDYSSRPSASRALERDWSRDSYSNRPSAAETDNSNSDTAHEVVTSAETSLTAAGGQQREATNILIEFSPTLFQLREFNLKCLTRVEQPLIEYAQELVVSVPAGQQFIQVDPHHQQQAKNKANSRQQGPQRGKTGAGQQRNRNGATQSGGSLSSSSSSATTLISSCCLTYLFLASFISLAQPLLIVNPLPTLP